MTNIASLGNSGGSNGWGPQKPPPLQAPGKGIGQSVIEPPNVPFQRPQSPPAKHPKKKRWGGDGSGIMLIAAISVLALIALMIISVWNLFNRAAQDVTLYSVNSGNVTQYVGGGGILFPRQQLDVSYPVSERVVSVLVKAGDEVTPNQSLIQLDPAQLNAQITQAYNDEVAALAYLNTVTAQGRNQLVIAQAQQEYNLAKNKYDALIAETSSPTLHDGNLISPMSGVVTAVNINAGEVFAAGVTLMTIMDETTVIVHAKIPLANLTQVARGQNAIVTPSALPNLNIGGTVVAIVPQADAQTDTFEVWVEVANPNRILLPGMSAFVRIQTSTRAMLVPRLAVLNPDRESVVFVVRNGHAYMQHVHVVGRSVNTLYIDQGISNGDSVVLVGANKLINGQAVHVVALEKS